MSRLRFHLVLRIRRFSARVSRTHSFRTHSRWYCIDSIFDQNVLETYVVIGELQHIQRLWSMCYTDRAAFHQLRVGVTQTDIARLLEAGSHTVSDASTMVSAQRIVSSERRGWLIERSWELLWLAFQDFRTFSWRDAAQSVIQQWWWIPISEWGRVSYMMLESSLFFLYSIRITPSPS